MISKSLFYSKVQVFEGLVLEGQSNTESRILHVCAGNLFGGVEKMVLAFCKKNLLGLFSRHHFALCFPGLLKEKLIEKGEAPFCFGPASRWSPLSILRARKKLALLVKNIRAEAVVFHGYWVYRLFVKSICRINSRVILMLHNEVKRNFFSELQLINGKLPDMLLVNSSFVAGGLPVNLSFNKVFVANPPILVREKFELESIRSDYRNKFNVGGNTKIILSAGRFDRGKGWDNLIEALVLLDPKSDWVWWFAGMPLTKSERKFRLELEKKVLKKLPPERVRWLGFIDDLTDYYLAADIYCQPNRIPESYGMTFAEADALDCPVVTTKFGGAVEILSKKEIHTLLPSPDPDLIAREFATRFEFKLSKKD